MFNQKFILGGFLVGGLLLGLITGFGISSAKSSTSKNSAPNISNSKNDNYAQGDRGNGMGYGDGTRQGMGEGMGNGQGTQGGGMGPGMGNFDRGNCVADECLYVDDLEYPVSDLTDSAKSALFSAIDDEYKAYATYDAVISQLGAGRPFNMILRAEEQHIASLKALFDKYGLAIPQNAYLGNITAPTTVQEACQLGVDAEIANASLYKDSLLPSVADYADITGVFNRLMNASQNSHLPAFEKCN